MIAVLYNFIRWILLIAQPILITLILEFIQNPKGKDGGLLYGLILIVFYILFDISANLTMEQGNFIQMMLGIKSSHGIIWLIYEKVLKISSATNKHFSQGEIINFIDVDVEKIPRLVWILPLVARFPIQLVFGLWFLYYYFGYSLFAAVGSGAIFAFFITLDIRCLLQ